MFFDRFLPKLGITQKVGRQGEKLAAKYLSQKGYVLLGQNYSKPWGEIDLIMKKGKLIQFVEVKSLSQLPRVGEVDYYEPGDKLTEEKKDRLYKTIHSYLEEKNLRDYDWQLGACLVYLSEEGNEVEFIEEI